MAKTLAKKPTTIGLMTLKSRGSLLVVSLLLAYLLGACGDTAPLPTATQLPATSNPNPTAPITTTTATVQPQPNPTPAAITSTTATSATSIPAPNQAEILWDKWGVPHIFAKDEPALFRAFGWAQAQSHGDLILKLYGQARGRAAEYWGKQYLEQDKLVWTMGFPERAREWYAAQSPALRASLDAFAAGINNYAQQHPDKLDAKLKVVLPVDGVDVLAHTERVLFTFIATNRGQCGSAASVNTIGSNGWAIGPSDSASGKAMLLANPHLLWSDLYTWYEAQLSGPGIEAYGAALVGMPVLGIAFNNYLGWTFTVNTHDGCDLYDLTLTEGGYRFDGQVKQFETHNQTLKVRQDDGSLREENLTIQRTVQGSVITRNGKPVALRVVGVDQFPVSGIFEQWWDMSRAKNLGEFETALRKMQLPMFTVLYADRDGHILYLFGGQEPVRPKSDWVSWLGAVPGDTSANVWTKILSYDELPRVVDPPNGWVQNSNSPPWNATVPPVLNPADFPAYLSPKGVLFREQRGIHMLMENSPMSFDKLVEDKFSTHVELADRVLDELIPAARQSGNDLAKKAADILASWDRKTDATSKGAVLFYQWVQDMGLSDFPFGGPFTSGWSEKSPTDTPRGLANAKSAVTTLATSATKVLAKGVPLDIAWGEVFRLKRGSIDLPASGGPGDLGIFRVLTFLPSQGGRFAPIAGDTYIAAVEFSDPVRAKVLNTYGNSSQPNSPHNGDQLRLYAKNELRPALRTRAEILDNLELRELV